MALSGPALGAIVTSLLLVTTWLYLFHDRENDQWDLDSTARTMGYWGSATGDFNWCEPDYIYTEYIVEFWNTISSAVFIPGCLWLICSTSHLDGRINASLVVLIGLGSMAFHATLQYWAQLLDELPMLLYVVHTVAVLRRTDSKCPLQLAVGMLLLCALLLATEREALAHRAGRLVMILCFAGCFIWLAASLAGISARLDNLQNTHKFGVFYHRASLAVLAAIVSWVLDNLACKQLHALPFGLPYPQLHAILWHGGMSFVCYVLSSVVAAKIGSHQLEGEANAVKLSRWS